MNIAELQERHKKIHSNTEKTFRNIDKIIAESHRVVGVAHNSEKILDDLDAEFEKQTGLTKLDFGFLFVAVGLQVARIFLMNQLTKIESAGNGNAKEDKLHELQDKLLKKFDKGQLVDERPYYASLHHIVSRYGVPYDAQSSLTKESIERLLGKDESFAFDLEDFIVGKNDLKLFKGANHRFATLGHDPILGLIFGTGNIMTNTITCVKKIPAGFPLITTNHVIYTESLKHPNIGVYGSTIVMLGQAAKRTIDEPAALVASLIKQIIHIGTDLFTPCGIQLPGENLILSNTNVEKITKYFGMGDVLKIGASAGIAILINAIISAIHMLTYDKNKYSSPDIYNVKTRKIIMYSNLIASGSNAIWTGMKVASGNVLSLKDLDIGGLIVTLNRLRTDTEFIQKIKEEFIFGKFNKMIQGDDLYLEEVVWN